MAEASLGQTIAPAIVLMGAAVVAVPLFQRLGLGSVLGYFAAGMLVGPSVFGLFTDAQAILHFSELGVVMFLFVIGLELRPPKLWAMRGQIFGLGLFQVFVATTTLSLTGAVVFGLSGPVAFIAGAGFVLSSTAVIMSVLQDRGEMSSAEGQKSVAILLFEDLMIVPLLAVVAFLSPLSHGGSGWTGILVAIAALALLLAVSRWALNPFFALLARARTREVLTAGALLVVLGAALLMEVAGLSMAMGAFLAGVMLSSSSYRHQIESDIEPFRGLLMGLFFLAVGMSLDLAVVAAEWPLLLAMLAAFTVAKGVVVYAVARLFAGSNHQALHRTSMFLQGGEFAFVLYAAAATGGVIDGRENALFSTVVILSMALTPLLMIATDRLLRSDVSMEGIDAASGLKGRVLLVGFGRFGQMVSQVLLSKGIELAVIDKEPDQIRDVARYGFKVYFGDGARLDVLRHSGAGEADAIMICIDDPKAALQIVELAQNEFPQAKLLVRSVDRGHAVDLIRAGVDYQIRETVESAYLMGAEGLRALGFADVDIEEAAEDSRRRDNARLAQQVQGDAMSGRDTLHIQSV
ncbi:MAG TPA: monovalent cation:proton antiporter-2 (CPA2) family protein [Bosea sp. (in: a-proteobacteria)]|jgi:glutathione-regulated potassium-efflux system protein KefB|uniref:monovalent cation:proton antiporter-2 (CPA2) family protein n=1 Tax=Bosea sp. (in: a-proteobacteria) TaxID=1871050 RepID=UPI002DDCC7AB|nr:monovalent cation:proton antiporter-2 (CPA2) family protein [Bosea sp. (in: a-proteobacteria)]HEV2553360.1 monovalent cation:proton antiporter-2 (CPA2) family protein [Bosea sp. (in: a-proteobacteria)]